jgi:DNA-binding GntR family transcriptional regulator
VREALLRLEREGILERRGRSLAVRVFTLDDVADIFALRAHVESWAARLAAGRIANHELLELQHAHSRMLEAQDRYARTPEREILREVTQLNRRFHRIVVRAARSPALERAIEHTVQEPLLYRAQEWWTIEDRRILAEEHGDLLPLLRDGRADEAERHWRSHLLHARDALVAKLAAAELEREAPPVR